jgi:RNA-directed DNA polymerase
MAAGPRWEPERDTPAMNDSRQSDESVVPKKQPNEVEDASSAEEVVEGRGSTKGNSIKRTRSRVQNRSDLQQKLDRVRQAAVNGEKQFTSLWHHVYDVDRLREAFFRLKRSAAPGIDRVTWNQYDEDREENLLDLSARLKRGAYRAKPVRRVHIPKPDGRTRPLGVPVLEDRIVQRAASEVIGTVYEAQFHGFSYGFRPGRNQHQALDALYVGITSKKVNWVLDADIRGFFDAIDHEWMMKFIEHRIADKRVHRHIKKWLNAGVMEQGVRKATLQGTPQGGGISPLLANIYLHYVLDDWTEQWRRKAGRGDVIIVRYADDFVVGFESRGEAESYQRELKARLADFGLELHPEKTRLLEFGRFASERRDDRGDGKPPTFGFLGFTHICAKTREGKFKILRRSRSDRMTRTLASIAEGLRMRTHWKQRELGPWLRRVLSGWLQYHAIPDNFPALQRFRRRLLRLWLRHCRRRSQRGKASWAWIEAQAKIHLPALRILHPRPHQRLRVST